jgi:hypothetical protein
MLPERVHIAGRSHHGRNCSSIGNVLIPSLDQESFAPIILNMRLLWSHGVRSKYGLRDMGYTTFRKGIQNIGKHRFYCTFKLAKSLNGNHLGALDLELLYGRS